MAQRRCLEKLIRHSSKLLTSNPPSFLSSIKPLPHLQNRTVSTPLYRAHPISRSHYSSSFTRHFSNESRDNTHEEEDLVDDDVDEEDYSSDEEEGEGGAVKRVFSPEEKAKRAAEIGYKVIGPLLKSDRAFKEYEPVFAVVQIGSHQFKVSNGDCIYTEKLKFCEVNDKLILNKVLLLGTSAQTMVGRPILPDAAVHAVVEEHALDAKVIIFKKKRRKNYRRTRGHRQELTRLRITSIKGIEIPEQPVSMKPKKTISLKTEKKDSEKSKKVPIAA